MALKTPDQNPAITDTVVFDLLTPDTEGCFRVNPYMVNQVTIYYVQRDFAGGNITQYDRAHTDPELLVAAKAAKTRACNNPTPANITAAQIAQAKADTQAAFTPVFYNEAQPVHVVGSPDYPAWLFTDIPNAFIDNITVDEAGNPLYGHFRYAWNPAGMREGDYFICWTWTLLPAGTPQSAHIPFNLAGDTAATTSIPTHRTPPDKYYTLLDRYLPETFKMTLGTGDLTFDVLDKLNKATGASFTDVEDLGNQLVDLLDANATAEAYLPLLARLLDIKLRSSDPTRWRRQVKRAVPLYKMKGTIPALKEAFAQAGMNMTKLTRLWQVISPYTWQESFSYTGSQEFLLSEVPSDVVANANFAVLLRLASEETYQPQPLEFVNISTTDGQATLTWTGPELNEGDTLLVTYPVRQPPNNNAQLVENYIRTLPLADQRDEKDQAYPLKNWNVRLIEEDDPMFAVVVATRHPYYDPLVYGKIRTEFAYSENVYGMEEYDGSLRDSRDPCDIDRGYLDHCGACQSSKYTVDLEIQNLSNDRLLEAQDILREFAPFHAVLHSINFSGGVDEFMQPPVETIECLVYVRGQEQVIAGGAQLTFGRAMFGGDSFAQVKRNMLASASLVASNATGTAYSTAVVVYCPNTKFDSIGMQVGTTDNILEVLSPSPLAGTYYLTQPQGNTARIHPNPTPLVEPIDRSGFTFRLSNDLYGTTTGAIWRDNLVTFSDPSVPFASLGILTQQDVGSGQPGAWQIVLEGHGTYTISRINPNGSLLLVDDGTLPDVNTLGIAYSLLSDTTIASGLGNLDVTVRGRVDLGADTTLTDVRRLTKPGQYVYDQGSGDQYRVSGFVAGESKQFYILSWRGGNVAGRTLHIYDRLVDGQIGYLDYLGQELAAATDLEATLGITNGANPPGPVLDDDHFRENFLIVVGTDYYTIDSIDGGHMTLTGPVQGWPTLAAGGSPVTFNVFRYTKQAVVIDGQNMGVVDRRGKEMITRLQQAYAPAAVMANTMNSGESGHTDVMAQSERIAFTIDYSDGTKEKGDI